MGLRPKSARTASAVKAVAQPTRSKVKGATSVRNRRHVAKAASAVAIATTIAWAAAAPAPPWLFTRARQSACGRSDQRSQEPSRIGRPAIGCQGHEAQIEQWQEREGDQLPAQDVACRGVARAEQECHDPIGVDAEERRRGSDQQKREARPLLQMDAVLSPRPAGQAPATSKRRPRPTARPVRPSKCG